jgi:hypothetical protein
MTVTTTTYTTNSKKITSLNEVSSDNLISAVDAAIVALGWTQYDFIDLDTYSPIETYVYRVLNADATTYKYWIIRWDTLRLVYYTSTCESWDISTNVPTNESWNSTGAFQQGYDIKDGFVFVSATSRHIMMQNFILNKPGLWSAVFEFERALPEDTAVAGNPCYAWTNSAMLGTPWGRTPTATSRVMFAFPRTPIGSTGAQAAKEYAPITSRGMFPPSYPQGNAANSFAMAMADPNMLHLGSFHNVVYGWNAAKSIASPVSVDMIDRATPFGRIYNVGISKNQGNPLDTANVILDSTGGWPASSGSNLECLLLPLNGGSETNYVYATNRLGNSFGTAGGAFLSKPIAIGDTVFISSNAGILTYSQASGQGGTMSLIYTNSGGVYDLLYDGKRTLYGAISNGVVTVDTETLASNTIVGSIGEGTNWLAADNKYVYVTASRASNTAPRVYAIYRSNNILNTANSFLPGTAFSTASWFGQPVPDYKGNVFVFQLTTATLTGKRLYKFSQDNLGGGALITLDPSGAAGYANRNRSGFASQALYDHTSDRLFYLHDHREDFACIYEYNPLSLALLQNTQATFSIASANAWAFSNSVASGQNNLIPNKGSWWISPQKFGSNTMVFNNTSFTARLIFSSPNATTTAGNAEVTYSERSTAISSITNTPFNAASHMWTNGTTIFATTLVINQENRLVIIDNLHSNFNSLGFPTGRILLKG